MTYIITFLYNNRKSYVYTGGYIPGIYLYLEMIVAPKTLTTSGQRSDYSSLLSSINNDAASLQLVVAALRMIQKSICKFCGNIGYKSDACIILGPKFLPPSLSIKMNQFKALHGEEPNEPPRAWSSQPPSAQFKSRTSPPNNSPVVSYIMGDLIIMSLIMVMLKLILQIFQ